MRYEQIQMNSIQKTSNELEEMKKDIKEIQYSLRAQTFLRMYELNLIDIHKVQNELRDLGFFDVDYEELKRTLED